MHSRLFSLTRYIHTRAKTRVVRNRALCAADVRVQNGRRRMDFWLVHIANHVGAKSFEGLFGFDQSDGK